MKFKILIISIVVICTFTVTASADSIIWNDTTIWTDTLVDDSSTWNDTTIWIDTLTDDSSTWNDTTIWIDTLVDDSSTWNDTIINDTTIDDSVIWTDTTNYIYDSINDIGIKLFWEESTNISINNISIEVLESPWGKLILNSKVLKEIILNINYQNLIYLDSSLISIKYSDIERSVLSKTVKIAYFNNANQSWETVNSSIDESNQRINAYIPPTNKIAVIEGDNSTPISTINSKKVLSNLSVGSKGVQFTIDKDAKVSLELFNISGRNVAILFSGYKSSGSYSIGNDKLNSLAKGNYILSLKINGKVSNSKIFNLR